MQFNANSLAIRYSISSYICIVAADAAPVTCAQPNASGAVVDDSKRCEFFAKFGPEDKKPDERVARNLKLSSTQYARSIALVVGIGKYANANYDIPAARKDVENLRRFLVDDQEFDEVIVLQDEQATIDNIRYFLRTYAMQRTTYYQGKVRFLFAYSGHGIQLGFFGDDRQPASRSPSVGLALSAASGDDDYTNIYGLNELRALFNDLAKNTYHFLALINACYGGDVFGLQTAGGSEFEISERGAYAITAGPNDKVVYSAPDASGSLFFKMIIEGIRSGDADHEALNATLGVPGSIRAYRGIVRLGALDGYLSGTMLKYIDSGAAPDSGEGNKHHWVGSVEPSDVRAEGAFFFFQKAQTVTNTAYSETAFDVTKHVANTFAPSKNQLSASPKKDGLERLRSFPAPVRGINVSHRNGKIDWTKVAEQKIRFAYIKATASSNYIDPNFAANWKGAKDAGIARGAYHQFSFCTVVADQFASIRKMVSISDGDLPVVLDIELWPDQEKTNFAPLATEARCAQAQGAEGVRESVRSFIAMIEKTYGQRPIIYGNDYVLDTVLTRSTAGESPLWRARYGLANKAPPPPWAIWQYTENEKIAGIANGVDANVLSTTSPR
jgi:GH25 family lysozyme M1 (1,4-beta-N-acetylmuramidase)